MNSRAMRWGFAALLVMGLLLLAWGAGIWFFAQALRQEVDSTVAAVREGEISDAQEHLAAADQAAGRFAALTPKPLIRLSGVIPWVGPRLVAARAVADTVSEVSPSAGPLLAFASDVRATGLRTDDGRIDLELIERGAPLVSAAAQDMRTASEDLAVVPMREDPSFTQVNQGASDLNRMARALDMASQGMEYLPGILGADGPRTYAILLQNTAEMRGSGGLVGAYALVSVDDGRVSLVEAAARKDGLDEVVIPFEGVATEDQVDTWGDDLALWSTYNLSRDFPFVGALTQAGMAARGTPVDGVIALDARVVSAVLAGTGPVEEGGARLTRDNAEIFFTRDIYAAVPDVEAKDDLTVLLLRATLERALGDAIDIPAFLSAAVTPIREGRLRMWTADPQAQSWLVTTPLGGALPAEPGPYVGIALNNAAGSKLDAYVGLTARYRVGICEGLPEQDSRLEIRLRNDAPMGLPDYVDIRLDDPEAPAGSTSLLVHVYGPQGADLRRARLDGSEADFTSTEEQGHPVWGFLVELARGQQAVLKLAIAEPSVAGATPRLELPPLAEPVRGRVSVRPCPSSE